MSLRSSTAASPWAIGITVFAAAMLITCQAAAATVMTRGAERQTYEIRVRGDLTDALVAALKPLGLHVEQTPMRSDPGRRVSRSS
jgi:hypothetical protein